MKIKVKKVSHLILTVSTLAWASVASAQGILPTCSGEVKIATIPASIAINMEYQEPEKIVATITSQPDNEPLGAWVVEGGLKKIDGTFYGIYKSKNFYLKVPVDGYGFYTGPGRLTARLHGTEVNTGDLACFEKNFLVSNQVASESDTSTCAADGEACWNTPCCSGLVCTGGEWTRSCRELKSCQSDAECKSWQRCFAVGGGTQKYCVP